MKNIQIFWELMLMNHMVWLGRRLGFRYIMVTAPKMELKAIHFAKTEADLNSSVRDLVDQLDGATTEVTEQ